MGAEVFLPKAQCSGANSGDVCGYRNSLGVVVISFSALRAPGENLNLLGLDNGTCGIGILLRALLWSSGSPRSSSGVFGAKLGFPLFPFDLLYKRVSSSLCIGSVISLYL
jgi:hypothetical protein